MIHVVHSNSTILCSLTTVIYLYLYIYIILYTTLSIVREQLNYNAVEMNMNSQQSETCLLHHTQGTII